MSGFLRMLLATAMAVLGWLASPAIAVSASASVCDASYVYHAPVYDAPGSDAVSERGPPTEVRGYTTYDTVVPWSHGTSVRPHAASQLAFNTYAYPSKQVQVGERTTTTGRHVVVPDGDLLSSGWFVSAAKSETAVIGKVADLEKGVGANEYTLLDQLPDMGSPKLNWKQNSGVLRKVMSRGQPIRDASVGADGQLIQYPGSFLNSERYLLQDRGWSFDPKSGYWMPPG